MIWINEKKMHACMRGTLGGAEHRNTAENIDKYRNTAKKIGKYRNTASKVDEIPKLQKRGIRRNLLKDFDLFARRMRLKDIFHGKENKQHPFYVKSTWEPPVQQSVALETFLEEVKFELANSPSKRPKDNLSPGERRASHNLLGDKTIIVKKADKGTTTVIMNREQKIKEGQILLNDLDNYSPLEKQMADETVEKIKQLTTSMLTESHIDEMTVKWLSQIPISG